MTTAISLEFAEVQVAPAFAAQMDVECGSEPASIGAAITAGFESLMSFVNRHSLVVDNPPRAIYTAYDPRGVSVTLAIPVAAVPASSVVDPPFRVGTLPGGKALRFTHHGPYPDLANTYNRITAFMVDKKWMESEADWARYMPMWEEYVSDPDRTPAAELTTYIYLPVT